MTRVLTPALALILLAGCATARPTPRTTLPADSAELLQAALARARPGFASQADALRAGVYDASGPRLAGVPAPEPGRIGVRAAPPAVERPVEETALEEARAAPAPEPVVEPEHPEGAPPEGSPTPAGAPATEPSAARGVRYVVQVGAFRSMEEAVAETRDAASAFPGLRAEVEHADGWYRLVLRGWPDRSSAEARLGAIRARYPDAWVRSAPIP